MHDETQARLDSRDSRSGGNINYSMLNDKKVDRAMNAAATLSGDARNRAWAAIDKRLIGDAAGILQSARLLAHPLAYAIGCDLGTLDRE